MLLYQSLYDLPNPTVCNLKSVLVLMNAIGRNLISVLGLTNPLGRRLISALVLTSHLKCQGILLILPYLAAPFLTAPGCFCLAYIYIYIYIYIYVLVKAPPRVCMKNKARGGVSRDKYSTRQSRVLYLSRDTPRVLYFSYKRAKGVL